MDVKIRNKEDIANFDNDNFKSEWAEIYDFEAEIIISYIKQSIEILLMMKDDEYGDIISEQK